MQKQRQIATSAGYVLMALLLITYYFFPSWYIAGSQKLFGAVYGRNAQLLQESGVSGTIADINFTEPTLPMFVIARPPQTPYDYIISTAPKGYQQSEQEEGVHYVYDENAKPIGYVEKMYASLFVVTLFSAPRSNEKFSVNGFVSDGVGEGGGSFFLQVPMDIAITVGMPIVHQVTGKVVSTVVAVNNVPEKNIQKVTGVLSSSPLEMAILYMAKKSETAAIPETVESVIDKVKSFSTDAEIEEETDTEGEGIEPAEENSIQDTAEEKEEKEVQE